VGSNDGGRPGAWVVRRMDTLAASLGRITARTRIQVHIYTRTTYSTLHLPDHYPSRRLPTHARRLLEESRGGGRRGGWAVREREWLSGIGHALDSRGTRYCSRVRPSSSAAAYSQSRTEKARARQSHRKEPKAAKRTTPFHILSSRQPRDLSR